MKRPLSIILILLFTVVTACRPGPAGPPASDIPAATVEPTAAAPATTPIPNVPPATGAAPANAVPPPLFAIAPGDRSLFAGGLTAAEQGILSELPGAPVYHMAISIDDSMTLVTGRQTVTYTNLEDIALEEVYFHLHPNTLDGAIEVTDVTVNGTPVATSVTDANLLRVPLPTALAPGEVVTLDMNFVTRVPTDIGRNYGVLAYYDDILALAHFYPMLSVYDGEGWNVIEPDVRGDLTYSDAAFYLVRVTAPADSVLVGSGAIVAEESGDGTQVVTLASGPGRDFYLAAGDFEVISETAGETTINSYAPADLADGAAVALDVAAAALAEHSARLAPYPYTELDIVTTPTSALGIEYPGLIVGTLRMYDLEATTGSGVSYKNILESTTAHEVAHQWFYNLIGNDQLDQPWLDEAIGSYSTYRYYVDRYGQGVGDAYFETFFGRWDRVNQEEIPIGLQVADYDDTQYSAIVYGRGPIFVRELEQLMGRETFDAFLRDYAGRFRWGVADTEAFRALAEQHCACDLGALFQEWVYE